MSKNKFKEMPNVAMFVLVLICVVAFLIPKFSFISLEAKENGIIFLPEGVSLVDKDLLELRCLADTMAGNERKLVGAMETFVLPHVKTEVDRVLVQRVKPYGMGYVVEYTVFNNTTQTIVVVGNIKQQEGFEFGIITGEFEIIFYPGMYFNETFEVNSVERMIQQGVSTTTTYEVYGSLAGGAISYGRIMVIE